MRLRAPIAATSDEASDGIREEGWMNRAGLSDKLLAIVMLATSLFCFARLYPALSGLVSRQRVSILGRAGFLLCALRSSWQPA